MERMIRRRQILGGAVLAIGVTLTLVALYATGQGARDRWKAQSSVVQNRVTTAANEEFKLMGRQLDRFCRELLLVTASQGSKLLTMRSSIWKEVQIYGEDGVIRAQTSAYAADRLFQTNDILNFKTEKFLMRTNANGIKDGFYLKRVDGIGFVGLRFSLAEFLQRIVKKQGLQNDFYSFRAEQDALNPQAVIVKVEDQKFFEFAHGLGPKPFFIGLLGILLAMIGLTFVFFVESNSRAPSISLEAEELKMRTTRAELLALRAKKKIREAPNEKGLL